MTDPRMTPTNDAPVTVERDDAFEDGVVSLYRFDSAKDRDRAKEAIAIALHRHRLAALASAPAASPPERRDLLSEALDALQPFADADERQEEDKDWQQCWPTVTVGDLRKARSVINAAATASAPAGDGVEAVEILAQAFERAGDKQSATWVREAEANSKLRKGYCTPLHMEVALDAIAAALARPRAAVGEREHFLAATIARSWMHHAATCQVIVHRPTGDGYKADCTCGLAGVLHEFDKHVLGAVTIPLQSPPAKVEGQL